MKPKKIGIYAGTFDPIHQGHMAFADEAYKQCGLDKVFFMVEPRPRRKQGVRALEHRQRMVQLAIAEVPAYGSIELDQAQFTVTDTLPILQARFKGSELYFLMGDDVLGHLAEWPNVDELVTACTFIIGVRDKSKHHAESLIKNIKSARGMNLKYVLFDAPMNDFSSSRIRLTIRKGGTPDGLDDSVADYINEAGLYKPDSK